MTYTLEQSARIQEIRRKSMSGTASLDELREATTIMREDRTGAQVGSTATRTRKAAAASAVDTGALLAGLKAAAEAVKGQVHATAEPPPPAQGTFKL
jgi:hypothetical protein